MNGVSLEGACGGKDFVIKSGHSWPHKFAVNLRFESWNACECVHMSGSLKLVNVLIDVPVETTRNRAHRSDLRRKIY